LCSLACSFPDSFAANGMTMPCQPRRSKRRIEDMPSWRKKNLQRELALFGEIEAGSS